MERTLIQNTVEHVGDLVRLCGYIVTKRDHGKITFLDLKDRTGIVQVIASGSDISRVPLYSSVEIQGIVKARPEKLINEKLLTGTVEVELSSYSVFNPSIELPIDMGKDTLDVELPTLLDHRTLTLKHPKQSAIFRVQSEVARGFRTASEALFCTEVFVPTISASSTEGGSEVFKVQYYDYDAFLIQSPQLYKQMMVGVYERVYLFSHVYRAEPSVTTRHLSEVVQMDCEFAFIDSFDQLLDALEFVGTSMISHAAKTCSYELSLLGIPEPKIPTKVPRLTLREAQAIVTQRTGRDLSQEKDLNPEDEREICAWAVEQHDSDFVTITHYPTKKRAFYTMPDPADPEYSLSYDLLFRGIEISSGSQRIHEYDRLVEAIKGRGMNPADFSMYLSSFQYGMPPEGGFSFGLERVTMKLLELSNVREASLFPRDMERVDVRLSTLTPPKKG